MKGKTKLRATKIKDVEKEAYYIHRATGAKVTGIIRMVVIGETERPLGQLLSDMGNEGVASWREVEAIRKSMSRPKILAFINDRIEAVLKMYPENYFV